MPWTPSTALAQSLQTLREPQVTTAEVSISATDANLTRGVPSTLTERLKGLGKADNHVASERE